MKYVITPERQAYLNARENTILLACPGSGKTTSIIYNLRRLIDEYAVNGGHKAIACLSFTNTACDEFQAKYQDFYGTTIDYPHVVSTIDSFVTQYIVIPYGYLIGCNKKIRIENDEEDISRIFYYLYPKDGVMCEGLKPEFRKYASLLYRKHPKECTRDLDGYKWKKTVPRSSQEQTYIKKCFELKLAEGVMSSRDALWVAYQVLHDFPIIAVALAKRFPYIIIDEAQDTSALQMEILRLLREAGVENMEFIGDVSQSIYSWREAAPEILQSLCATGNGFNVLSFTECRRSVQRVIDLYSMMRPQGAAPIISTDVTDMQHEIVVYRYADGMERETMTDFIRKCEQYELKDRLILARGKDEVCALSGKNETLDLWKSSVPMMLIDAKRAYVSGKYKESIRLLRKVWCECETNPYQIEERKRFMEELESDGVKHSRLMTLMRNLPDLHQSFGTWQTETETLLQQTLGLDKVPDFQRKKKINGKNMCELLQENVDMYYGFDCDSSGGLIHTIHDVKGATCDAVLLFMSENHHAQTISVYDFPDFGMKLSANSIKEKHNLIYVACSRAKQFLALAMPMSVPESIIRSKLGNTVQIVSLGQLQLFE